MNPMGDLTDIVETSRGNAIIAWWLVAFVALVALGSFLGGDLLWGGFATVVAVLTLAPVIALRDPRWMLPWEVLALAALPLIGRAIASKSLAGEFATYLAVAAIALIIAVEMYTFTPVRMSSGFAVLFVVVATMATAGVWAVVRWSLDVLFGTTFLVDPTLSDEAVETALMWEFVYSTAAGLAGGVIFEGYFRRRARIADRLGRGRDSNRSVDRQ